MCLKINQVWRLILIKMDARITKFIVRYGSRLSELKYDETTPLKCSVTIKSGKKKGEVCGRECGEWFCEDDVWKRKCRFHTQKISEIINEEKFEWMENQVKQMEKNKDLSFLPLPNDICEIISKKKIQLEYGCYMCGEMPIPSILFIHTDELHKHSNDVKFMDYIMNGYGDKKPMCYGCMNKTIKFPYLLKKEIDKYLNVFPEITYFQYMFLPEQEHMINDLLDYCWTRAIFDYC